VHDETQLIIRHPDHGTCGELSVRVLEITGAKWRWRWRMSACIARRARTRYIGMLELESSNLLKATNTSWSLKTPSGGHESKVDELRGRSIDRGRQLWGRICVAADLLFRSACTRARLAPLPDPPDLRLGTVLSR
jgi:hypothetical protein